MESFWAIDMKKVKVRTTSGRVVIRPRREKFSPAKCAGCGKELLGVPSGMRNLAKSERRPSRAYGGYYCGSCVREVFREKVRLI